ncbi:MAG: hypothetical protein OIF32_10025 [Campylobacterales bacterium]|nr:hypothetical protein [Campylobacterales bacterium]
MVGKKRNLIIAILTLTFGSYGYFSENRHIYDRLLIKEQNLALSKKIEVIKDLENRIETLQKEKRDIVEQYRNKKVLIDCSKPVINPSKFKKVKPLETKLLPKLDTVQIDEDSKIKIAPIITPDKELGGAKFTIEKKF